MNMISAREAGGDAMVVAVLVMCDFLVDAWK
jgi:hypothetical protein